MIIRLDGESLTIQDVAHIAYDSSVTVELADSVLPQVQSSRELVEEWVNREEVIYGVTTGFGEFANVVISTDELEKLQANLIRSHAVGAGKAIEIPIVRAMIALRINAVVKGFSGIRIESVQTLLDMLNKNVIPVVPRQGSVGSSGDLVQLAHLVLAGMGEGHVWRDGTIVPALPELEEKSILPLKLRAKEGLALINGTQMMTAFGSLALHKAQRMMTTADIISALSVEALKGTDRAYDERTSQCTTACRAGCSCFKHASVNGRIRDSRITSR